MRDVLTGGRVGPLDLLVIQPTPFCNLDCSYCYLPDRQDTRRISTATLEAVFERAFASGLVERPFTVIWHAGEPLVLPPSFYEEAFAVCDRHNTARVPVHHSFQTNGTLLNAEWCRLFKEHEVRVGVSVDGPAFLHDACRKTRSGKGTLDRVVAGIELLHEHGVPFTTITVLTLAALDYPDELFEFYRRHRITFVGFNVEEVEGPHQSSSLSGADTPARLRRFWSRFYDLALGCDPPLRVREFDTNLAMLTTPAGLAPDRCFNHQTEPLAIVSVDCEGNFSTFSPELVGLPSKEYGDFMIGNVATDSFALLGSSPKFLRMAEDVAEGVRRCREGCDYFAFCGGGAPANKYFENGSFASSETMYCRLGKQAVVDVLLGKLERAAAAVG